MSAFEPRPPFKKRIVSASLTEEQFAEFRRIREALGLDSDGAVIKRALLDLSYATLGRPGTGWMPWTDAAAPRKDN